MLDDLLNNPNFIGSPVDQSLRDTPLGFVDIGARGGAHALVEPAAGRTGVVCFEPDPSEFARLTAESSSWPFADAEILPTALAGNAGAAPLYLTRNPNNTSLLKPADDFYKRYGNPGLDVVAEINVSTQTLDDVLFDPKLAARPRGELLKVDAQGADYLILQGARRVLTEQTVAIVCEACFIELYAGQKLFGDIEVLLRDFGFAFYGFLEINMRAKRLLDKRTARGRERMFWVDAVFFKDPISAGGRGPKLSTRQLHSLFVSAILCGYYDFALELALDHWAKDGEADRVRALISALASYPIERTAADVQALAKLIAADPENANVHAGRYIDERRTFADYRDVPR